MPPETEEQGAVRDLFSDAGKAAELRACGVVIHLGNGFEIDFASLEPIARESSRVARR